MPVRVIAMSDLHLGKKPWQVRKALQLGQNADIVLLAGDLVNDGTPEQMERMKYHLSLWAYPYLHGQCEGMCGLG